MFILDDPRLADRTLSNQTYLCFWNNFFSIIPHTLKNKKNEKCFFNNFEPKYQIELFNTLIGSKGAKNKLYLKEGFLY